MFQRSPRRFRRRSNGRGYQARVNGGEQTRLGSASLSNVRGRNNFQNQQSAEKLAEKYKALAKEALSSGDKTLSESYFQHADHFMRIVDEKSLNQNQNKVPISDKQQMEDNHLVKKNDVSQNKTIEVKEEKK